MLQYIPVHFFQDTVVLNTPFLCCTVVPYTRVISRQESGGAVEKWLRVIGAHVFRHTVGHVLAVTTVHSMYHLYDSHYQAHDGDEDTKRGGEDERDILPAEQAIIL